MKMWYIYEAECHSALKKMKGGKVDELGKYNVKEVTQPPKGNMTRSASYTDSSLCTHAHRCAHAYNSAFRRKEPRKGTRRQGTQR